MNAPPTDVLPNLAEEQFPAADPMRVRLGWVLECRHEEQLLKVVKYLQTMPQGSWEICTPVPDSIIMGHIPKERSYVGWGGTLGALIGLSLVAIWIYLTQITGYSFVLQGRAHSWQAWPAYVPALFEALLLGAGVGIIVGFLKSTRLPQWYHWAQEGKLLHESEGHSGYTVLLDASCLLSYVEALRALDGVVIEGVFESVESTPSLSHRMSKFYFVVLLIFLLVLGWLIQGDDTGTMTPPRIFNNMAHQARIEHQGTDETAPYGSGPRQVPPKTVAAELGLASAPQQGGRRLVPAGKMDDFAQEGREYFYTGRISGVDGTELPPELFAQTRESLLVEGQTLWLTHCAVCHGHAGKQGAIIAYKDYPALPTFTEVRYARYPLGKGFRSIAYGQGNMPPFHTRLSAWQIWFLANWSLYQVILPAQNK